MGGATNADVLVVGSGVAGLSAALAAAEEGASVVVCEKQRALGGTSNFFQGAFAVESRLQRARILAAASGAHVLRDSSAHHCLGTMGGISINERCEVLDSRGKVIPGLYAAGYDAGGMYGDSYPIRPSSGLSSAFAINSGRIAGENAARMERG